MIPCEISPAFLFVVAILSAFFFFYGFLYLLCRILQKNRGSGSSPASEELDDPVMALSNPFQRQLQQLFRLHDSGLDQAFVDALPVFLYKDIVKGEVHFDCAVCLSEFSEKDKLISSTSLDARRCYSMGLYRYVVVVAPSRPPFCSTDSSHLASCIIRVVCPSTVVRFIPSTWGLGLTKKRRRME